ncbi:MAG: iron-sulfur cluster assembly accessory protein [Nitrospira sp.]|nr:iron-sulfur cluster assembly accessory protein [Nitrospira sp.]
MSLNYVKFTPGFDVFMPKEYRDMVEHGPFGKKTTVSQMGNFKEILEEHPMCAGCAMTLFIRLAIIAFPNPEDTITVGTAGCGRLAISQAAIPFVYGNYGDQNGVASGLSRGLRIRFGDQPKDVVVIMDSQSAPLLAGCEVDYMESVQGSGFAIKNPQAKTTCGCGSSFSA